jgi:hypothetical protein
VRDRSVSKVVEREPLQSLGVEPGPIRCLIESRGARVPVVERLARLGREDEVLGLRVPGRVAVPCQLAGQRGCDVDVPLTGIRLQGDDAGGLGLRRSRELVPQVDRGCVKSMSCQRSPSSSDCLMPV